MRRLTVTANNFDRPLFRALDVAVISKIPVLHHEGSEENRQVLP